MPLTSGFAVSAALAAAAGSSMEVIDATVVIIVRRSSQGDEERERAVGVDVNGLRGEQNPVAEQRQPRITPIVVKVFRAITTKLIRRKVLMPIVRTTSNPCSVILRYTNRLQMRVGRILVSSSTTWPQRQQSIHRPVLNSFACDVIILHPNGLIFFSITIRTTQSRLTTLLTKSFDLLLIIVSLHERRRRSRRRVPPCSYELMS